MTAGVILAGGPSSRFVAEDKALATIEGIPMIRVIANQLVPIVDQIVVNVRSSQQSRFEPHLANISRPVQFAIDKHTDAGPVAGLNTALKVINKEKVKEVIIIACDIPLIRTITLSALLGWFDRDKYSGSSHGIDCVLPLINGRIQPLCGIYSVDALNAAINMIGDPGSKSCNEVIEGLKVLSVPQHQLPGDQHVFTNVNTKNDLKKSQEVIQKRQNESLPSDW